MEIYIPFGREIALKRNPNAPGDRALRKYIENLNSNGDCIINVGNGYYRPIPGDIICEMEKREYIAEELAKARSIQAKCLSMSMTFERWREFGIPTNDTRKA
jgi:hypothetical protein